jgi:diguanylate cyclase (GGDEF)-like protein
MAAAASARNDLLTGAVALTSIVLLIQNGSRGLKSAAAALLQAGGGSEPIALTALFLNVALILFAWRRFRDLRSERENRVAAEEHARTVAACDQLTGLLVRHALAERAPRALEQTRRSGGAAAVLVVNVDRFKHVNDVHGHAEGDRVLRTVAAAVAEAAPRGGLCARLGGDEFCLLLPGGIRLRQEATEVASAIVSRLAEPLEGESGAIHVSASVGLAAAGADCSDFDGLLRRADIAMHAAKEQGRSRLVWFDDSMEEALKGRSDVEIGLRRGIPLGEFVPHYQPQVDLADGRLRGFEVLARWYPPEGGIVGPDTFIPVAEEIGLIGELFERLLHQALSDAKAWPQDITLSVNISPTQLLDAWLPHKILKIVTETGFPADRLEVEITESSLLADLPLARASVTSLKNQGVKLALDDFGTGYASLANLRALPFDRIKIDRSFVQTMEKVPESLAIVTAIARIGESLGVPVTAEGVETAALAERLAALGCGQGQGWQFGRAVNRMEAERMLAQGPQDDAQAA